MPQSLLKNAHLFLSLANMTLEKAKEILNVSEYASPKEINIIYRRLAKNLHPDINKCPEAAIKFIELSNARDILLSHHYKQEIASQEAKIRRQKFKEFLDREKAFQQESKKRKISII